MQQFWYAVRVRANHEHKTAHFLKSLGYDIFHPTYRDRRQWSDRVKELDVPLFSGYVFCHMDIHQRLPVMKAPGVVEVVGFGKTFLPIPDQEIAAVRAVVNSPAFARPCPYLQIGERVRVEKGPLAGVEGILLERKTDTCLVVSVHLLQRSIATQVDVDCVRAVTQSFSGLFPPADAIGPRLRAL